MIDSHTTVSYAQYNEDLILAALFSAVDKGFYVDVGASYPETDSVTKLFYDKGWHGINVEPIKSVYEQLQKQRPNDINVNCGIGAKNSVAKFREYTDISGHSTFDPGQKKDASQSPNYTDYTVAIKTLQEVLKDNNVDRIHFLKVDVEGYEQQVIDGNDWDVYRPYVVCMEANHATHDLRTSMTDKKYKLFISDGLNEYYVAEEQWSLTDDFAEKAVTVEHYSLRDYQFVAWSNDLKELDRVSNLHTVAHDQLQKALVRNKELEESATLSLKNISLSRRIKRAVYGLTVDWARYKKQSPK